MRESAILEYTERMQGYVDAADRKHDCIDLMEQSLCAMGALADTAERFRNVRNRLRYLWAKHGGFELMPTDDD